MQARLKMNGWNQRNRCRDIQTLCFYYEPKFKNGESFPIVKLSVFHYTIPFS